MIKVDRWVEHTAGRSVQAIMRDRGEAKLQALRMATLERAIANKPPAIIALDDDCARAVGTADLRYDRATFFWLQREDDACRREGGRSPVSNSLYATFRTVRHFGARWFRRRGSARTDQSRVIRADGTHPWTTAKEILGQI